MSNGAGNPIPGPVTAASILLRLTGAATLAAGAFLVGQGTSQLASTGTALTWASNTLTAVGTGGIVHRQAATKDGIKLLAVDNGSATRTMTITTAALGGDRTATLPDATITIAGINLAQTWTANQTFDVTNAGAVNVLLARNLSNGTGAQARIACGNDGTAQGSIYAFSSTNTGTTYGLSSANLIVFGTAGTTASGVVFGATTDIPVVIGQNLTERMRFTSSAATLTLPLTFPNGTAAAPGARVTGEASGLYRFSATELGFAAAGAYAGRISTSLLSLNGGLACGGAGNITWNGGGSGGRLLGAAGGAVTILRSGSTTLNYLSFETSSAATLGYLTWQASNVFALLDSAQATTSVQCAIGATTMVGSERLRIAGGSAATAGATDVCIGGGEVRAGGAIYGGNGLAITGGGTFTNTLSSTGIINAARTTVTGAALQAQATGTLSGAVTDGYLSALNLAPTYDQAFTVTRHNFINLVNPGRTNSAVVTDACVFRFDAAAGTHKALDAGTTKTSPGTVTAWLKVNENGTVLYVPAYASKTT